MNNILVVDDEAGIWEVCRRALERQGYLVHAASNGDEALDLLEKVVFDIALVDIRMPCMDGLELLKHIKKTYPHTEVIIITAETSIETAVDTLRMGAFDYLIKPFLLTELLEDIKRTLEHARLRRKENVFRETTYLYQLSHEVHRSRPRQELVRFILERAITTLKTDTGSVFLLHPESGDLEMISHFGSNRLKDGELLKFDEQVAAMVARNWQPLTINDGFRDYPHFNEIPALSAIASTIAVPLVKQDTLFGVLCLNRLTHANGSKFTHHDIESLQIFATHAALVLALHPQHTHPRIFPLRPLLDN